MKRLIIAVFLLLFLVNSFLVFAGEECTIGVAVGKATSDGRPILWKNRDISPKYFNNDIRYVKGEKYHFLALMTVGYSNLAWAGTNEKGFCIINSASRDLSGTRKKGPGNGEFMKMALGLCANVDDFEKLLQETNLPGRRTNCNYGVIDANGGAAIFETRNYSYTKFDANNPKIAPQGFLVRANFAHTSNGNGGIYRYRRAKILWEDAVENNSLNYRAVISQFARDLADTNGVPFTLPVKNATDPRHPYAIETYNTINRSSTAAAVVFCGVKKGEDPGLTTMWSTLGEPIFSIAVPAWVSAEAAPITLTGEKGSPLREQAMKLLKGFYYSSYENGKERYYLTTFGLPNLLTQIHKAEDDIFQKTEKFLAEVRKSRAVDRNQLKKFQDRMSQQAFSELKKIASRNVEERTIKVGVFCGEGASPVCVKETMEALKIDRGIVPFTVSAKDIVLGAMDNLDVIVFPGGSGSKQACNLGARGREIVRNAVLQQGKGCVGICAGGYLLSSTPIYPWSLKLISANVFDREHYNRGRGLMEISFTDLGKTIFPEFNGQSSAFLQYYDGPVLVPSQENDLPAYSELAIFVSDIHLNGGSSSGVTPGKTVLLANEAGKGRVFVSAGHPEATPGMRWMVPRMVRWVAGRKIIPYPEQVVRTKRDTTEILFTAERVKLEKQLFWKLVDNDPAGKIAALKKLIALRSRPALRWAIGLLRDTDKNVRFAAAKVLAGSEYTPAIDDLKVAVQLEKDKEARNRLTEYLKKLEKIVQ